MHHIIGFLGEKQIIITIRFYLTFTKMTLIQATDSNVYWYGCEETRIPLYLRDVKSYNHSRNCLSVFKKLIYSYPLTYLFYT